MFSDDRMLHSIKNTFIFTFYTVVFCNIIGLGCALAIKRSTKFNNFIRMLIFMPFTISLLLSSYMWRYVFSDVLYQIFGIISPLGNKSTVMFGISLIAIWRLSGYCMVVFIAALQGIPSELYESAQIEGAGKLTVFRKITLPLIVPAFTANITLLIAWGMKVFDYPMAATGGGPGFSSMTLAMLIYYNLFQYNKAGYGQAIAIVFTIIIFIFSTSISRLLRKSEVEL